MGGSIYKGYNDSNTPTAEYNVATNVSAAQTMFSATYNRMRIYAAPLDTAGLIFIGGENYQQLVAARYTNNLVRVILENYYYSRNGSDVHTSTVLCDVEAAHMSFSKKYLVNELLPIRVNETGFTVIDYEYGMPTILAMSWAGLQDFADEVTKRLLSW